VSGARNGQSEDIEKIKLGLLVKTPHTKAKKPRLFMVLGENYL
jgi:hypothetical protein